MKCKSRLMAAIGAAATVALAPVSGQAADEVVVGVAVANSGIMTAYDGEPQKALEMFVEETNAKGGLLGKTLRIVRADTKSDIAQGTKAGIEVLDQGAQMVVVSCDYDHGAPAANEAQKAGKISFFLCADDVKAGGPGVGPYSFSGGIVATVQGALIAEWGVKEKGFKTTYILRDVAVEYNKSVCNGFKWMVDQIDEVKLLGEDTFTNSDASISAQISRIKALPEEPDYIMLCSYIPGGAAAIKQLRAAGVNSAIVNGNAMDGTYWLETVPGLSDFYFPAPASAHGDDPNPDVQEFNKRFEARWGAPPTSFYTYSGWTVMEVWAKGVERAGSFETEAVVAELEKMDGEKTLFGPRSFPKGMHIQTKGTFRIIGTQEGKMSIVDEWKFDTDVPLKVMFGQL